jgi:hypothetical protein
MNLDEELSALRRMTPGELQKRYAKVFGERPRSRNRHWLTRRIAWRLQALEEGDLSQRARRRAEELANDADLRTTAPRGAKAPDGNKRRTIAADSRLPLPGTVLTRKYEGQTLEVKVRCDGLEYEGQLYKSLTAIVREITGVHWNGYHFFGLKKQGGQP